FNSYLGGTWAWTGADWSRLTPATSPSARSASNMTYDAGHGQLVLFGGGGGGSAELADTCLFDGSTWTQAGLSSTPEVRCCAAVAADVRNRDVVLFGGQGALTYGDTWLWDGQAGKRALPAAS